MLGRTKDFGKDNKYLIELHEIAIDISQKLLVCIISHSTT